MAGKLCCVNRILWKVLHSFGVQNRSSTRRMSGGATGSRSRDSVVVMQTQAPGMCSHLGKDFGLASGQMGVGASH